MVSRQKEGLHWRKLEKAVVYYYTQMYANLGSIASQRVKSYHLVVRKITNGQLSFEESRKRLGSTVLSLPKELSVFEYESMRGYDRRIQVDFTPFQYLIYESSLRVGHGWRESLYRHPGWLKSF